MTALCPKAEKPAHKPAEKRKNKALLAVIPVAVLIVAAIFLLPKLTTSPEETGDIPVQDETDDAVLSEDAAAELLVLIDQAEELHEQAINALPDLSEDEDEDGMIDDIAVYVEHTRQWAQIMKDFLADLAELQKKADAVSGLDNKMKSARDEHFTMLHNSRNAHVETYTFIADYLEFWDNIVAWRPLSEDYEKPEDYSSDLSAWVQEAQEGYASVFCPESLKGEWAQYGEILTYNASIAKKLNMAVQYDDVLRFRSTFFMTDRYMTVEENLYRKFLDRIADENSHANKQRNIATNLAEEMHAYAELEQEEKEAYEFEYIRTGKIYLDYDAVDTIYPSLYNTYDAFVIFKTGCGSGNRTVLIEAEIPGFTQKYQELFRLDPAYTAIYIKPPALTGNLDLSAAKSAQINITVSEQDGTLIDSKSFPVTIKSKYDFDWYSADYGTSTQDDILCFLTPEASAVTKLKRQAIDAITAMSGGAMESFVGYQQAVSKLESLYDHLSAGCRVDERPLRDGCAVQYESLFHQRQQPAHPAPGGRHRESERIVYRDLSGNCRRPAEREHARAPDLPPGHAQVAVEVWNRGEGRGDYFLIETTSLDGNTNNRKNFVENANKLLEYKPSTGIITYYSADEWYNYLSHYDAYVVDCDDVQLLGLTAFAN